MRQDPQEPYDLMDAREKHVRDHVLGLLKAVDHLPPEAKPALAIWVRHLRGLLGELESLLK